MDREIHIAMVILANLPDQIDFQQTLGRIGRFNEVGHWYRQASTLGFEISDADKNALDYINAQVKASKDEESKEGQDLFDKYKDQLNKEGLN